MIQQFLLDAFSVTRWEKYFSIFGHLHQWKFAQKHKKFAKIGSINSPIQNEGFKNCQGLLKFSQSGDFSPNLVTLDALDMVYWLFSHPHPHKYCPIWYSFINEHCSRIVLQTYIPLQLKKSDFSLIFCAVAITCFQCDQMARLYFIIWLLTTTQICPKFIKIGKVGFKFCRTQNKTLKCLPKNFESLPKCRNFAKSGHTAYFT